jgi:SAM-dependent methyltransferase
MTKRQKFLKRVQSILKKRHIKFLIPKMMRGFVDRLVSDLYMADYPDRRYMTNIILPNLSKLFPNKVLFVGTRSYTRYYRIYFNNKSCEYCTIDINPEFALFGSKNNHIVGNILEAEHYYPINFFDIIVINGVFGYGVDDADSQNKALEQIHKILKKHGVLLLGWNNDRVDDPLNLDIIKTFFFHDDYFYLPKRKTFSDTTHCYDLFTSK